MAETQYEKMTDNEILAEINKYGKTQTIMQFAHEALAEANYKKWTQEMPIEVHANHIVQTAATVNDKPVHTPRIVSLSVRYPDDIDWRNNQPTERIFGISVPVENVLDLINYN